MAVPPNRELPPPACLLPKATAPPTIRASSTNTMKNMTSSRPRRDRITPYGKIRRLGAERPLDGV